MIKFARFILTGLFLPLYTRFFIRTKVRKPKSDLKTTTQTVYAIDKKILVDIIEVKKIDTETSFLKNECLIGITFKGKISHGNNKVTIDYLDAINFVDIVDNQLKQIKIEIIPSLKSIHPNQKESVFSNSKIKYNETTEALFFEVYLEKVIVLSGFGNYAIDIQCANRKETIEVFRYK